MERLTRELAEERVARQAAEARCVRWRNILGAAYAADLPRDMRAAVATILDDKEPS